MKFPARLSTWAVLVVASVLGLLIAACDLASPFGDDSAQFTLLLWLVSSGVLGFARPARAWRWAVAVAPWVALVNLVRFALGLRGAIHPSGLASILFLVPVSVAACMLGAYGGALARRHFMPRSPSFEGQQALRGE